MYVRIRPTNDAEDLNIHPLAVALADEDSTVVCFQFFWHFFKQIFFLSYAIYILGNSQAAISSL